VKRRPWPSYPTCTKSPPRRPCACSRLQEAELRELAERIRSQDELLEATVNALATICEQLPGDAPEVAAKLRDLMFDRKKRIDRAPPL